MARFWLWEDQIEAHRPDPTPEIIAKAQELTAGALTSTQN